MLFDTTFLIDYEREVKRSRPGPAHAFLTQHPNAPLYISINLALVTNNARHFQRVAGLQVAAY